MPEQRTIPIPAEHREFIVKVDGTVVERVNQLLSATITKVANKISSARLVYLDGNAASGNFPLSSSGLFIPGKSIEILGGSSADPISLFKGIIIKHNLKIRDTSAPQLILECRHKAVKLTVGRKNAYYFDKKDSEIIGEILENAGIQGDLESTAVTQKQMVQYYSTDWDFLLTRAQSNGKIVLTNDDSIKVKSPDFQANPSCTLLFGSTILEMDAEMDARWQYNTVKSHAWDPANQEISEKEAQDPGEMSPGNLDAGTLAGVIGLETLRLQQGMIPEDESQAWADAQWLWSKMSKISGRLKCEGIGTLNPGDVVTLEGTGDRFNGNVLLSGVRHNFDLVEGWKTFLQFGSVDDWFGEEEDVSAPAAGGLLPGVQGLQIGLVTDNEDPEGEFRVRVKMPMVDPAEDGNWARVASLDAGDRRGFFFRPEIGDEVILGFLDGDPRQAIVLGMLHSSAKPAPLQGSNSNAEKMYQSRDGLKLYFNDEKRSIRLETPGGKKLTLDDNDQQLVRMEDENGNKLEMSSSGIRIESATSLELKAGTDFTIEGTNMAMKGSASMKAEASGSLELKSSGSTVIRGTIVQIN